MAKSKKIAVALSGGIDSSVCALLLKNQGYEVIGITGKMTADENFDYVVKSAKAVANKLNIEHHILNFEKEFNENIIEYFINSYKNGETPNPCILCNKKIKWGCLFDYAINKLNCDYIATGHYANIIEKNGQFLLYPAKDTKKDQLYYLFELDQYQLSKTLFPLKNLKKEEIKKIANENNLPNKSSKESQDICFIKKPYTTKKFLTEHILPQKGNFILEKTGEIIGEHDGFFKYTIGQRKGIGIAYKEPLYVTKLSSEKNEVYCGTKQDLIKSNLTLNNFFKSDKSFMGGKVLVKIRYNMNSIPANITIENNFIKIEFIEPVSGITKGQACVLYSIEDGHLIGGGWI